MATFYEKQDDATVVNIADGEGDLQPDTKLRAAEDENFDMFSTMKSQVTSFVWEQGKEHAQKAYNLYGNIDVLRPYFHVELHELRSRLLGSLIPHFSTTAKPVVAGELYGPLMLVFTLIALLLFEMKSSGHEVKEGTLMGTAFVVTFGYWFGASTFTYFLAYVCNAHISFLQILSLLGYALFGNCLVILMGTIFHPVHNHIFFYAVWLIFGGLSALKMVTVLFSRTSGPSQRLMMGSFVAVVHLLFMIYLHFAYHATVDAFDHIS